MKWLVQASLLFCAEEDDLKLFAFTFHRMIQCITKYKTATGFLLMMNPFLTLSLVCERPF